MKLEIERRIEAPPSLVFDVASDFRRATENLSAVESLELLTEGPIGVGTRFRETRIMFGKEATEEMEITAFDPPRSYTVECRSHGTHYVSQFRVEPDGTGTRYRLIFDARPQSLVAKLMTPLAVLMRGTLEKALRVDFEDVARVSEARAAV
ncbi:MAG: SRPBCC family protein [Acidobacteriota bacterium]